MKYKAYARRQCLLDVNRFSINFHVPIWEKFEQVLSVIPLERGRRGFAAQSALKLWSVHIL